MISAPDLASLRVWAESHAPAGSVQARQVLDLIDAYAESKALVAAAYERITAQSKLLAKGAEILPSNSVCVEEVEAFEEERIRLNAFDVLTVDIYENGELIDVPTVARNDWRFTGLGVKEFVAMRGWEPGEVPS